MNKEQAKEKIAQLVVKFSSQIDYYKSNNYNEIDQLVYKLYDLTEEEIKIVEAK